MPRGVPSALAAAAAPVRCCDDPLDHRQSTGFRVPPGRARWSTSDLPVLGDRLLDVGCSGLLSPSSPIRSHADVEHPGERGGRRSASAAPSRAVQVRDLVGGPSRHERCVQPDGVGHQTKIPGRCGRRTGRGLALGRSAAPTRGPSRRADPIGDLLQPGPVEAVHVDGHVAEVLPHVLRIDVAERDAMASRVCGQVPSGCG